MPLSLTEQANQITAYKAEQRSLRAAIASICNGIAETERRFDAFNANIVEGGAYDAAIPAHQEAYSPQLEAGLTQLRQTMRGCVTIAQALHGAAAAQGENLFPGLWMPEPEVEEELE